MKTKHLPTQKRKMVVDLDKSGNGSKKQTQTGKNTSVKIVGYLPGIEPMSTKLPHSERRE